jgi:1-acylglycerone phosphate reductase
MDGYISPFTALPDRSDTLLIVQGLYASTKRATEVVADTLRLELSPFGVTVLAVVTGGVKSSGQTYFDDLTLPQDSLYKGVEETIVKRAKGGDGMPRMETSEYAKAVVEEMEKGKGGKFWYGEFADMVKGAMTNVDVPTEVMVSPNSVQTLLVQKKSMC